MEQQQLLNWFWAFCAALVSTTYFFLIKAYAVKPDIRYLISVIGLELLVIYLYYQSLRHTSSAIIYAVINAFSVLMGAVIAVEFFGEDLTSVDLTGIVLIVLGIILVGPKKSSVRLVR